MTTGVETLDTRELKPRIGTEVLADKATLLSGDHAESLRDLLEQRDVLVFPRIGFTDDEQIAFTQTLGTYAPERSGGKLYNVTLDTTVNAQADYLKGSLSHQPLSRHPRSPASGQPGPPLSKCASGDDGSPHTTAPVTRPA